MSRNNDVFQVLVTKGNSPVLPINKKLEDLKVGQIGVFNSNTNLSIDKTSSAKEFFLAVGADRDGDGLVDSVNTSAGQVIQKSNIRYYTFRPHTAPKPMVVEISNFKSDCDTEYAIKLEFRNQEIYRRQGYNQFSHTYAVKTTCCDGCVDCLSGDCNELAKLLIETINADTHGLVKAEAVNPSGAVVTDIDAFIAANAAVNTDKDGSNDVCLKIRLTTIPQAIQRFCNINLKYYHPRQTVVIPSLLEGFSCAGEVTVTQEAAFEEGDGYDIRQKEYHAGGWNGRPGPYRASTATGLGKDEFEYFADSKVKYDQFTLTYDQFSVGGWQEYLNNLATIIAIPAADTTTRDGLAAVLDAITGPLGFDALADDAASANVTPTVTESTSSKNNPALDGIG